jgi:hypothetical protein
MYLRRVTWRPRGACVVQMTVTCSELLGGLLGMRGVWQSRKGQEAIAVRMHIFLNQRRCAHSLAGAQPMSGLTWLSGVYAAWLEDPISSGFRHRMRLSARLGSCLSRA